MSVLAALPAWRRRRAEWEEVAWLNVCLVCPLPNSLPHCWCPHGCSLRLYPSFSAGRDSPPPQRASSGSHCSTVPCPAKGPLRACGSGQPLASKKQGWVTSGCFFLPGQALFPFLPLQLLARGTEGGSLPCLGGLCHRSQGLPAVGWIQPEPQQFTSSEAPMGEAEGLNNAAELQWGGCAERNDVAVERHLAQVLLGDGRVDRMLGLVLPLPLCGTQPNQGQHLQGWTEGTGCKEKPGANSACPCSG